MSIKAKLLLMILGVTALFAGVAAGYFCIEYPVRRMEEEKYSLMTLSEALKDEMIQLDRFDAEAVCRQAVTFTESSAAVENAFGALDALRFLPKANEQIGHAVKAIRDLAGFYRDNLKDLGDVIAEVVSDTNSVFDFGNSASFSSFHEEDQRLPEVKHAIADIARFHARSGILHLTLSASCTAISEQYSVIDAAIGRYSARARSIAFAVFAVIVAVVLAFALRFANSVAESIITIEKHIAQLREGDLTKRLSLKRRDELGCLANDLNLFQSELDSAIIRIKDVSAANIEVKAKLIESANESLSATTQIGSNSTAIAKQITSLDARVDASVGSVAKIASNISGLDAEIEKQFSRVEDSTAGITEMLSALENMSRVTKQERDNVNALVDESSRGAKVFEESVAKISEVPKNISAIRDMVGVIQGIAAQTDLLAMNAAIEAAHAGEVGRGFAVVAEEMRKLAEVSTRSSHDIAASIEVIVGSIEDASKAGEATSSAFGTIDTRIREVSASMSAIFTGIAEMNQGGKLILEAITDLRDRSAVVKGDSKSIDDGASEIHSMMEELRRISNEVASNISEISSGIDAIASSVREVSALSERVGEGSLGINSELDRFSA